MQLGRILFPCWDSIGQDHTVNAWQDEGYEVDRYPFTATQPDTGKREADAADLVKRILGGHYRLVFTVNYLPVVAMACKACRIRYVSWVYDSPCVELFSETAAFETNYIFIFDQQVVNELMAMGLKTVYYLPLAADVDYYDRLEEKSRYQADISFVGSLYNATSPQFAPLEAAGGYLKGYLDGLVAAQQKVYGANFLERSITPMVLHMMQQLCALPQRVNSNETTAWLYANYYLAKKVTEQERRTMLGSLSRQFRVAVYTYDSTDQYQQVDNMGIAEYYKEMPLVFKNSAINLNISLRSILSGIPLRAFDIMGCGGFLLSNYQADLCELFVPDEDFVFYEDEDDLVAKVSFYLNNDEERKRIAHNGYEKVKQFHTYRHRIRRMVETAFENR
jgi:spore maturation protein CgeB